MSRLEREGGLEIEDLRAHHLIGRAWSCHLRIELPEVSGLHAALQWSESGWELRDLGSRNGTWLDGRLLSAGERAPLVSGAWLAFGRPDRRWRLVSDAAPPARAFPLGGGPARTEQGGVLALPTQDQAELLIFRDEGGAWWAESDEGSRPLGEARQVLAGAQRWELELPELDPRTPMIGPSGAEVCQLHLSFQVSLDEEHVALHAAHGGHSVTMEPRAHHYLLLVLARRRLEDQARLPGQHYDHGWISVLELGKMLRVEETQLNLQIFRLRRQFAEAGFRDPQHIVERRRGTGQLRIGPSALSVARGADVR